MENNEYYERLMGIVNGNKDSIFEPCKILEFDMSRMVGTVQFLNSKQKREDVIVLFPALFLNSGIISPPPPNTTALAFWGADRIPYVLPAQYMIPDVEVKDGAMKPNASPAKFDSMFDISNIQLGEIMLRSLGGAYVFVKNMGEIEIATQKLHRLTLSESDGSFNVQVDKTTLEVGGLKSKLGEYIKKDGTKTNEQNYRLEAKTSIPQVVTTLDDRDLAQAILTNNHTGISIEEGSDELTIQALNVFDDEDNKETSPDDGSELLLKSEFKHKGEQTRLTVSKQGTLKYEVGKTSFMVGGEDVVVKIGDKETSFLQLIEQVATLKSEVENLKKGDNK